jgi:hypothetical protein
MLLLGLMGDILSPGGRLALRKAPISCRPFLGAERHKAKACKLQLTLMA